MPKYILFAEGVSRRDSETPGATLDRDMENDGDLMRHGQPMVLVQQPSNHGQ